MVFLAEGAAGASTLAGTLAVSRPTITVVVDGLVAKGFVERQGDDTDRRKVHHRLTPSGRRALDRADAAVVRAARRARGPPRRRRDDRCAVERARAVGQGTARGALECGRQPHVTRSARRLVALRAAGHRRPLGAAERASESRAEQEVVAADVAPAPLEQAEVLRLARGVVPRARGRDPDPASDDGGDRQRVDRPHHVARALHLGPGRPRRLPVDPHLRRTARRSTASPIASSTTCGSSSSSTSRGCRSRSTTVCNPVSSSHGRTPTSAPCRCS